MSKRKSDSFKKVLVSKRDLDRTLALFGLFLEHFTNSDMCSITGLPLDLVNDYLRAFRRLVHREEWRYTRL